MSRSHASTAAAPGGRPTRLRRVLRGIGLTVLVLIAIGVFARLTELYLDARPSGPIDPFLQRPAPDAVTVRWRSDAAEASTIRYRPEGQSDWIQVGTNAHRRDHSVRIADLQQSTRYHYRLGDAEARGGHFRTPPAAGRRAPTRIWVLGDPGADTPVAQTVRDTALSWMKEHPLAGSRTEDPDLILTTGDNAYPSGRDRDFRDGIFRTYAEPLAGVPLWPAHGNHDARRSTYGKIFELPTAGESGGEPSRTELYYSFLHGAVHVIVLDSERRNLDPDSKMGRWLERDLAGTAADWRIVVVHRAPHSRGSNDSDAASGSDWRQRAMREDWMPILERHGVDLVLAGHSHGYERSRLVQGFFETSDRFDDRFLASGAAGTPDDPYRRPRECAEACGTIYLVAGMSALPKGGPLDHPMMAVAAADAGSVVFDIQGPRLTGRYLRADGTIGDTFVIEKTD